MHDYTKGRSEMIDKNRTDIKENYILKLDSQLLSILLKDNSSKKNIIWATDGYADRGCGYESFDYITIDAITGRNGSVIKPRIEKSKKEQLTRVRDKAEVFTPSWICNKQNNLVDAAWFGKENVFNIEIDKKWETNEGKIVFPQDKTWQDYVKSNRMEISCGEAPYLVSRYDTVTGDVIAVKDRVGILDRKLRIVSENIDSEPEWYEWAKNAIKSVYGYDWQGDNILLARENLLFTFVDYYIDKFGLAPVKEYLIEIAEIISWNIWQMDGLKFVIPNSCIEIEEGQISMFEFEEPIKKKPCEGCIKNLPHHHTGIYCKIMDWEKNKAIKFVSLIKN